MSNIKYSSLNIERKSLEDPKAGKYSMFTSVNSEGHDFFAGFDLSVCKGNYNSSGEAPGKFPGRISECATGLRIS